MAKTAVTAIAAIHDQSFMTQRNLSTPGCLAIYPVPDQVLMTLNGAMTRVEKLVEATLNQSLVPRRNNAKEVKDTRADLEATLDLNPLTSSRAGKLKVEATAGQNQGRVTLEVVVAKKGLLGQDLATTNDIETVNVIATTAVQNHLLVMRGGNEAETEQSIEALPDQDLATANTETLKVIESNLVLNQRLMIRVGVK